jgi:hypothetical protein
MSFGNHAAHVCPPCHSWRLTASEPPFDRLHDDRRWLPLLRTLGMAPEQLAQIQFNVSLPPG